MLDFKTQRLKQTLWTTIGAGILTVVMHSCANMGHPDGGPFDETPPKFIGSTPKNGALNNHKQKFVLEFDEFIKIEKAAEKVIVSPPQVQMPEIKQNGKSITVNLLDSLKANTTYTVDFSDAIVDNNEGNALGNFTYVFSTGARIDTMEVSGYVLDAATLEPVKGILVGLHSNLADSTFTKLPFERVSRTDSRGHFVVKGIAPGTYHIFGLQDANQNFAFDQKSEMLAYYGSKVVPKFESRNRRDTLWRDSTTVDTIKTVKYTHYLPDDIVLRAFKENSKTQYLIKNERLTPQMFSFYFADKAKALPTIKGLNFDEKDAFFIDKSLKNDTLHYWIKNPEIYKKDTLSMALNYLYTDTLGKLVPRTDTLNLTAKRVKEAPKKKLKEGEVEPTQFLQLKSSVPSVMEVYSNIRLEFEEPIAKYNEKAIHLQQKVDSLWKEVPFVFKQDTLHPLAYQVLAEWQPEKEYQFQADSTAFQGMYGLSSDKIKSTFKVRSLDEYATLFLNISGADSTAFVELLDAQDKALKRANVVKGKAEFFYLTPGKYYVRLINDTNGNGVWDTGNYAKNIQPEEVFYYPQMLELRALWETEQEWNVRAVSLDKQKLDVLKKQKPDEDKKKKRVRERDAKQRSQMP